LDWYVDSHAHASTVGLGYEAVVREFRRSGGRLIALVGLTPGSYGLETSLDGVLRSIDIHLRLCSKVRGELGGVLCLAGVHPATVDRLARSSRSLDSLYVDLVERVMKHLERYVREGLADGLGEFGRPHYPATPESIALSEVLTVKAMELARDYSLPIHIHSESSGRVTSESLKILARYAGLSLDRVLVHHVPPTQAPTYTSEGFYVSVVGRSEVLSNLASRCERVLVESDYLDDPRRPGAVMYPWDIPREVGEAVSRGALTPDCAREVLQRSPLRYYGVEL
jgi:TatD-related deoxyribonuclease